MEFTSFDLLLLHTYIQNVYTPEEKYQRHELSGLKKSRQMTWETVQSNIYLKRNAKELIIAETIKKSDKSLSFDNLVTAHLS